ncbi:MAG: HNH endonuclease [Nanoarchaeota archaeon]
MNKWITLRNEVRKRDNQTCQECGKVWNVGMGRRFHVHHTNPYHEGIWTKYRLEGKVTPYLDPIENLVTLCPVCHKKICFESKRIMQSEDFTTYENLIALHKKFGVSFKKLLADRQLCEYYKRITSDDYENKIK